MADESQVVEKIIAEVMESHFPQMKRELAERLRHDAMPQLGSSGSQGSGAVELLKAVSAIHAGTTQKEILRALLDGTTQFCGRAALFVVKSGAANGWQGRGFENSDEVKDFALDVSNSTVAQVLETHSVVTCKSGDMDSGFVSHFASPAHDQILLMPLLLKDKVAALVYADGGSEAAGHFDQAALELLVAITGAWLEVVSLRKHAAKESTSERETAAAPEVQQANSYSDPFAGHAPKHAMAASAGASESGTTEVVASASAAAPAPALDPFANLSAEDADVHRKAQRFARLLIDEVKLYNQAKVAEGRKKKDLYDRLKEDIEKSRSTYLKRYGNTVAASGDYVNVEIIRSLAGDDESVLGPNFHR